MCLWHNIGVRASLAFVNRLRELREFDAAAAAGGLLVVYGRRRVGKTRVLRHWLASRQGWYSQAIEASAEIQIAQVFSDIQHHLDTALTPKTWGELFEVLRLQPRPWRLCLDEFPYLVAQDASLPSRLQRFLDHDMPKGCLLVLSGSSTRMMHDTFLNRAAPLYGRARKVLSVAPMDYHAFCAACRRSPGNPDAFEQFSLVGGVPKYWESVEPRHSTVDLADALYFDDAAYMEQEPQRLLRDEGLSGITPLAVLETIGRGAERPSEMAARLGTVQTNLSRVLQQLLDASILARDLPYGESTRTTKKVLYRIADPTVRCWFRLYSPHRSLWRTYTAVKKRRLIHEHASTVFEDVCRAQFPGAGRYWEGDLEIDLVAPDPEREGGVVAAEVEWRRLTAGQRTSLLRDLEHKWARSALARRHAAVRFAVLDAGRLLEATEPTPRKPH